MLKILGHGRWLQVMGWRDRKVSECGWRPKPAWKTGQALCVCRWWCHRGRGVWRSLSKHRHQQKPRLGLGRLPTSMSSEGTVGQVSMPRGDHGCCKDAQKCVPSLRTDAVPWLFLPVDLPVGPKPVPIPCLALPARATRAPSQAVTLPQAPPGRV